MKIAILDDYQDSVRHLDCFALLAGHEVKVFTNTVRGIGHLAARLADFDALVLIRERTSVSRLLLEKLPRLKLIAQTGKVSGHIDIAAATARGIVIVEGIGDATAPAELTWALIMAATRKLPQYIANLKKGVWQASSLSPESNRLGTTLKGKTLGIWGYGRIGQMIARYGATFGMKVVIWGRSDNLEQAVKDGYQAAPSKETFFKEADIVSLHLRLNEATRGIVSAADLALMKPDALFVNTSRAELIVEGALLAGLQQGCPGYAALDVFESEPLVPNSPLLHMDNVLASPHIGYVERESYEMYFSAAFRNVIDFANGVPKNMLNPEAWQP